MRSSVAASMSDESPDDSGRCQTIATFSFALGIYTTILWIVNTISGAYGSPGATKKVVWASALSMGELYPHYYVDDMSFRPYSDTVFLLISLGLLGYGAWKLHEGTEGGFGAWATKQLDCSCFKSLFSVTETGPMGTVGAWCILLGFGFYVYECIQYWNWVDVGVYSVTAALLGFGFALTYAASAEQDGAQ